MVLADWTEVDGGAVLVLSPKGVKAAKSVIGFDIDWTVIQTKSGRKFATGRKDWDWLYPCVPDKLKALHKAGHKVVFVTNQAGIEKKPHLRAELTGKFEDILAELKLPIEVYVCAGQNQYRKPSYTMWELIEANNKGVAIDKTKSMYVGDAAGRAKGWAPGKPKDFSAGDRMFGANAGIGFATPEAYFLGEKEAPFKFGTFDAKAHLKKVARVKLDHLVGKGQEMVLLCGPPACGKSTLAKDIFVPKGYVSINRDTLKTMPKCVKAAKVALEAGSSVVIDNTNPSRKARADFVALAKKAGVPVRCLVMDVPAGLEHHMNFLRVTMTSGGVRRIPMVAYRTFAKNREEPSKAEGFAKIEKVPFTPRFADKHHEVLFSHWYLAE